MRVQIASNPKDKRQKFVHSMPKTLVAKLDRLRDRSGETSRTAIINSIVEAALGSARFKIVVKK